MFIVFEGIDHVGKSTQVKLTAKWFRDGGKDVIETREPGGSAQAEEIRRMVLSPEYDWDAREEMLLFYAARRNHLRKVINPHRNAGGTVICDRFALSTLAYQSYKGVNPYDIIGMHRDWIKEVENPDLTIVMTADDETIQRNVRAKVESETKAGPGASNAIAAGMDRFEGRDKDFHDHLREVYEGYTRRCYSGHQQLGHAVLLDVSGMTIDEVQAEIRSIIMNSVSCLDYGTPSFNVYPE